MSSDPYSEKNASRDPAIELLRAMGYTYVSPEDCRKQRGSSYYVLLKDVLRGQLRRLNRYTYAGVENEFSAANIERAMDELDEPLTDGLVRTSEKIYDALMLGKSYPETVGEGRMLNFNLHYIDWEHPERNVFHVAKEFFVESRDKHHNAQPDIVLFINGIPFAVIECKNPLVSEEQAISQMLRNQKMACIPQLFKYTQIVLATNRSKVKYATTGTAKKFWSVWKEQDSAWLEDKLQTLIPADRTPTTQDGNLISLFSPERVLELMRYFIIFDAKVKKICRYQQYFAIKAIMRTIAMQDEEGRRRGGVVWHTQGSGKSLTMVMLAKCILMELAPSQPRVVVVSDRKDLDRQITATFAHTRLRPARAGSGKHLVSLVNHDGADIVTCIINKFITAEQQEVQNSSREVFVLVDESHRSQYGPLSARMRRVFPNACYLGFTGTPLLKQEKRNTLAKFGGLIHQYTIQDGVNDKAIVPLIYEGRLVEQKVDEQNIDLWFEKMTRRLTKPRQEDLQRKWSSMRRLASTDARIRRIALDINEHFMMGYQQTGFKAMLACNYKQDAIRYLECFEEFGDLHCAVVISPPDMREGADDTDESNIDRVHAFWGRMMEQYGDADSYEEALREQFCTGEIDILIVCSKLLTGFNAPICQLLYIDKELKEHGLLQAIARTNRLHEGKEYGLIVDYRGLVQKLDTAMNMYSGAGLDEFDCRDLKGLVTDVTDTVGELRDAHSRLLDVFSSVTNKRDTEEVEVFLADEKTRELFYAQLCHFGKKLHIVLNSERACSELPTKELRELQDDFIYFSKVRKSVKIRYCDGIDHKEFEPIMQNLLDTHLSVSGLRLLTRPIDILNQEDFEKELEELGSTRARADAITHRLNRSVSKKWGENPAYYNQFSKRIKATLEEYRQRRISEVEYLDKMRSIMEDYSSGKDRTHYPERIKTNAHAQAFYGVLRAHLDEVVNERLTPDVVAELAETITNIIARHNQVDWSENETIHSRIAQQIDDLFYEYETKRGIHIALDTVDQIIEQVKIVAINRF